MVIADDPRPHHGPGAIPTHEGRARILRADVCASCHDLPMKKFARAVKDPALIAFVNREKTKETVILATRGDNPLFTAVFNGNEAERTSPSPPARSRNDPW